MERTQLLISIVLFGIKHVYERMEPLGCCGLVCFQARGDLMEFTKTTEYREHAVKSEGTSDADSKLHLLAMAEGWQLLADKLGRKDAEGRVIPF
jgi:hypothetical protein